MAPQTRKILALILTGMLLIQGGALYLRASAGPTFAFHEGVLLVASLLLLLGGGILLWRSSSRPTVPIQALVEQLPEATLVCAPETWEVLTANAAALSVLNLGLHTHWRQPLPRLLQPELWPHWQTFLQTATTRPASLRQAELSWCDHAGLCLELQVQCSWLHWHEQGYLLIGVRDITRAVHTRHRLQAQEERLRLALAAAGLSWVDWDIRQGTCAYSGNFHSLLPRLRQTRQPWTLLWPEILTAADQARYRTALDAHLHGQSAVFDLEFRISPPDDPSGPIWLRQIGQVLNRDEHGRPERMLSVLQDVTAQKQTEQIQQLGAVVFESQQATLILDHRGRIQLSNKAAVELLERSEAELTGRSLVTLLGRLPDHPRTLLRLLRRLGHWQGEVSLCLGVRISALWISVNVVPGEVERYVVQLLDLTGKRQLQEYSQRLQGSRLFARHLIAAQEAERKFLARELHDAMGQYLVGIRLYASLAGEAENAAERIQFTREIERAADAVHQVVRGINRRLLPADLEAIGLLGGLRNLVTQLARYPAIKAEFSLTPPETPLDLPLDELVALNCYRVVQEALNNVVKHAQARNVRVSVRVESGLPHPHLAISVQDDGVGMDLKKSPASQGVGLLGMRERVEALGGEFAFTSVVGLGTHLSLTFRLVPAECPVPPAN